MTVLADLSDGNQVVRKMRTIDSGLRSLASILILAACWLVADGVRSQGARGESALVAVATNFSEVAQKLAAHFQKETGHKITLTTGSTGKLYAQIVHGAPYDVLLAADHARPKRLEQEGHAIKGSCFTYAQGRLTFWSPDPERINGNGLGAVPQTAIRNIAMAHPTLAPYGTAAREALQALELWDDLRSKIVMGENIGQAYSLVATGNAEAGFVALSYVLSPRNKRLGSRWDIPADLHKPIRQSAVLLRHGANNAAAVGYLAFLRGQAAKDIITGFGYEVE